MSEVIKANIEVAFGDEVEVGLAEHPDTHGRMAYLGITPPDVPQFLVYFGNPKGLDDTIEALMKARRDAFGTKP